MNIGNRMILITGALTIALCGSGCSRIFETREVVRDNRVDTYLAKLDAAPGDYRVPQLAGYARTIDSMLSDSRPVTATAAAVQRAQVCFERTYGPRSAEHGNEMISAITEGREGRWKQYQRIARRMQPIDPDDDACRY